MGSIPPPQQQEDQEYPPKASLARDIYRPFPTLPPNFSPTTTTTQQQSPLTLFTAALNRLTTALAPSSTTPQALQSVFLTQQAYWRDHLALTWHIRTLHDAATIAPALSSLAKERSLVADSWALLPDSVHEVVVSPQLRWIEGLVTFETAAEPAARCGGRIVLFPEDGEGEENEWRIWTLATWVEDLKDFAEDEGLLVKEQEGLLREERIETDVVICGAGNAGIVLAACLKARGVESILIEKNPRVGDNWALRYDCLRFHIGKHSCDTPYYSYPDEYPLILPRDLLAGHMRNYAAKFHLNVLLGSKATGSSYNKTKRLWTLQVSTPTGTKIIKAKHLVQANGLGGNTPYIPALPGADKYQGVNIHSAQYKNPTASLATQKSVIVVGSANSAFDVLEDLVNANHSVTMIARSPTFLFPWTYALDPHGLGAYEFIHPTSRVDALQMSGPIAVTGPLVRAAYAHMAAREPHRYDALAKTGFPVYDSVGGRGDLMAHILERAGGHFNDIGDGVAMLVDGRAQCRGLVEPVAYSERGLVLSDGEELVADAVVWCTGFKDRERAHTAEMLGGVRFVEDCEQDDQDEILGPQEVAALRDGVWGVDGEGEMRGVWRRHLKLDNFWITGGATNHHRYYGRVLALQIKAALEGILPEASR